MLFAIFGFKTIEAVIYLSQEWLCGHMHFIRELCSIVEPVENVKFC